MPPGLSGAAAGASGTRRRRLRRWPERVGPSQQPRQHDFSPVQLLPQRPIDDDHQDRKEAEPAWLGYRSLYPFAVRKSQEELDGLLKAVESQIRSALLFGSTTPFLPPPLTEPTGGG